MLLPPLPSPMRAAPSFDARELPIVIAAEGTSDLSSLFTEARAAISARLDRHGAILFRGFGIDTAERLDVLSHALAPGKVQFIGESSPRSRVAGEVFTSTDYPPEYPIQLHNEYSYARRWPMKLFFACLAPPTVDGATPIADSRRVLARLSASTRDRFRRSHVRYVRHFIPHVGVSWETAFQTSDRAAVEAACREEGIQCEWDTDGRLTTTHLGPAIALHPRTGEEMWFNHAFFFHVRALEPEAIREFMLMQPEEDLSTQTYFGDGEAIGEEVVEELRAAFRAETTRFAWQRGDVLLIDNMLTSHGRDPFEGPRKIIVRMAEEGARAIL